ncbi:MAG: C45 family peptidase [Planctomycetota bacterium]
MHCDRFTGDHYQIGLQIGERYALWIQRAIAHFVNYHSDEFSAEEMAGYTSQWEETVLQKAPKQLEQLKGVCKAADVNWSDLLAMNFRFWNAVDARRAERIPGRFQRQGRACTNIALRDPQMGLLLGGTLDDFQLTWHIAGFAPKKALKHICVTWIGTAWAGRGINEAGLAIGNSALKISGIDYPKHAEFTDFILKQILEQAEDVDGAIEILHSFGRQVGSAIILADRKGNCRLVETCWAGEVIHQMADDRLFCVNHVQSEELRKKMIVMAYQDNPTQWSLNRYEYLTKQFADTNFQPTRAGMERLLANHDNYPESMCHIMAAYVTIAAPQSYPGTLFVADGPSCRKKFQPVTIP